MRRGLRALAVAGTAAAAVAVVTTPASAAACQVTDGSAAFGSVQAAVDAASAGDRLVIDQGFATTEEVQHCLTQAKASVEDKNQRSLADLLVDNDYVTKRQMTRLSIITAPPISSMDAAPF